MPTTLAFTIDDLDAEVKNIRKSWENRSDYEDLRSLAFRKAMAEYQKNLIDAGDLHVLADNFASPIAIGSEVISLDVGDLWRISLPSDAIRISSDSVLVEAVISGALNDEMLTVPRSTFADVKLPADATPTDYAFWEKKGKLVLYAKQTKFDSSSVVAFEYFRNLDVTQTAGTTLDITPDYFPTLVDSVVSFLESYV